MALRLTLSETSRTAAKPRNSLDRPRASRMISATFRRSLAGPLLAAAPCPMGIGLCSSMRDAWKAVAEWTANRARCAWRQPERPQLCPSAHDNDANVAVTTEYIDGDITGMSTQENIDLAVADTKTAQAKFIDVWRQYRIFKANFAAHAVAAQAEARFYQRKRRRTCPGLRRTGNWIACRSHRVPPRKAAEQLRRPQQVHVLNGGKQRFK